MNAKCCRKYYYLKKSINNPFLTNLLRSLQEYRGFNFEGVGLFATCTSRSGNITASISLNKYIRNEDGIMIYRVN